MSALDALDALRALALPHASAHARDALARPWPLRSIALAVRDGDPLRHRTTAEHAADHAIAYTLAAEVFPGSAARYTRVAAGWCALVVGEDAVRATGAEPAGRGEVRGDG